MGGGRLKGASEIRIPVFKVFSFKNFGAELTNGKPVQNRKGCNSSKYYKKNFEYFRFRRGFRYFLILKFDFSEQKYKNFLFSLVKKMKKKTNFMR
jgi:hypothetical protein